MRALPTLVLAGCAAGGALFEKELASQRQAPGIREAITVASVVGDAYWPSVAPDGSAVVFTAAQGGSLDIWKKVLATGELVRLTDHSADDEDPAVSPDGKRIAFVSRREDAKGDIYLMSIDGGGQKRLTDVAAAERAPAWAPDGKSLFISVRPTPDAKEDIHRIDVETGKMERITKDGGFDATVHPKGHVIAYARPELTAAGATTTRLTVLRLSDKKTAMIGDGRRPEAFPRFAGEYIYFTRYLEDDTRDTKIDAEDVPCLYRVPYDDAFFEKKHTDASEPITSGFSPETLAAPGGDKLFFVGAGAGGLEIQVLPFDGASRKDQTNAELLALADSDIPPKMRRYFLRVVQQRGGPDGTRARYEIARDYAAEGRLQDAQSAFDRVIDNAGADSPLGRLARLEQLRNQYFMSIGGSARDARSALDTLRERAADIAPQNASSLVRARARVIVAEAAQATDAVDQGLTELALLGDKPPDEDAARVALISASLSSLALPPEIQQQRLIDVIRAHPRQVREVKQAVTRILALLPEEPRERLEVLSRLLPLTQGLPVVRGPLTQDEAEVLSKLGEARLAIRKLEALQQDKELGPNDLGRVLFSLGTAQENAGELGPAIATFERLAIGAQFNRVQKNRGRTSLLRLALKKAREDEGKGEIASAYEAYRTLARNNPLEAGTHRKVLELADKLGKAAELDAEYGRTAAAMPFDRVAQYASGLAATYVNDLSRAKKRFEKAIELDAGLAYAHMALGWVYEQEEYRSPGTSDALERAINEYTTARALFESTRATEAVAEAALNLGNAFGRLGQFDQAFDQYRFRDKAGVSFQNATQEILFRERYGQAAFRAEDYETALVALNEGLALAEREGDDRRLGRMRALVALCYDALEKHGEALESLVRARDEYATNGDFNRVVALDRTIGWLSLQKGDFGEATAALERAQKRIDEGFGPKGFKWGVTFRPLGLVTPIAVDNLDASRAPMGFSRDDETELLQMLLGRIYARIGDTEAAAAYQERRLAMIATKLEKDSLADFLLLDFLSASIEMMKLALRRGDITRAAKALEDAVAAFAKAERRKAAWILPHLELLARMPLARLDSKARAALFSSFAALEKTLTPTPKDPKEEVPPADPSREAVLARLRIVQSLDTRISHEREQVGMLPTSAQEVAEGFNGILARLNEEVGTKPASSPASQPASAPVVKTRAQAAALATAQLDAAELAFLEGRDGERALLEAEATGELAGLWDVGWQADYVRYRLGPTDKRAEALARASTRVELADTIARLVTPTRPRGAVWQGLLAALIHDALTKNDPALVAKHLERRYGLDALVLPLGFERPDLQGAEASRAALDAWAAKARDLIKEKKDLKALRDHLATARATFDAAVEPWRSLIACTPKPELLSAVLGNGETFDWFIPSSDRRLHHDGKAFSLVPRDAPLTGTLHYVAGDTATADVLRVATANALVQHDQARNIFRQPPLVFTHRKEVPKAQETEIVAGKEAEASELAQKGVQRALIRFILDTKSVETAPGVFRFAMEGRTSLEAQVSSLELPQLGVSANTVVIDGLSNLDPTLAAAASRALALSGTPTTIFCAPTDATKHQKLLTDFLRLRETKRAFEAWREASAGTPDAGAACQFWGLANDDSAMRVAFAEKRLKELDDLANEHRKKGRNKDAKPLFEAALDFVQFLNPGEKDAKLSQKQLNIISALATICALLAQYDDAISFQDQVIARYVAAKDTKSEAAARKLLGEIFFRAAKYNEAAEASKDAAALFLQLQLGPYYAASVKNHATALLNAGAYAEAVKVYRVAAEAFTKEKNVTEQVSALRNIGITLETRLSEFDEARDAFLHVQKLVDAGTDKATKLNARIDVARIYRQLANYEAALKTIRELQAMIDPTDHATQSEALLELARVYWFSNDYERALLVQGEALRHALEVPTELPVNARRAEFLRIQAMSLEGLILLSQGKRISGSNRLRRALALARTTKRRSEESAQLNNFGFALRERGLLENAEIVFTKAIAIDSELKSKDGLAFDFRNLGVVLLREGRLAGARTYLEKARELNKTVGSRYNEMQIQLGLGELALAASQPAEAKRAFEAVIAESVRLKSRDTEWRARLGLAQTNPAVARAELEKALGIVEALGPKLDEAQSEQEKVNLLKMSSLYAALAETYAQANDAEALWQLLERMRLKELRDQVPPEVWQKRLGVSADDVGDYGKLSAAAKSKGERELLTLFEMKADARATVTKALAGRTVVHLRLLSTGIAAVVASEKDARIVLAPIAREAALLAIGRWVAALDNLQPPPPSTAPLFDALASVLDDKTLDSKRLLIIGDGTLSRLPWSALPVRGKHLVERTELSFELSAAHALDDAQRESADALTDVTAIGPSAADGLPFAELETRETVALFSELEKPARYETLDTYLRASNRDASFLHLALHGDSRGKNLSGSFVKSGDSAKLFALSLLEARRKLPTVLLSACHRPGSEPNGVEFVTALKLSGSRRVIVPASRVYDDYAASFVKRMVRRLATSTPSPEALRTEQLAAIARGEPPASWGGWLWYGR